jgi:hypothetical protein
MVTHNILYLYKPINVRKHDTKIFIQRDRV